jgi:hypothetical protein
MPLIRTPRSVKQYANVVRFSLGLLPGEVNPVDVMILEGMRLFAHDIFDRVKEHIIPKVEPHWMDNIMDKDEDKADKLMKKLLTGIDDADGGAWRATLVMLFPAKLSHASHDESEFLAWTDTQRVACDEYFIRYLAAVVPDNDVPDAEVGQWMAHAEAGDINSLVSNLQNRLNTKTEEILVQKVRRVQRHLSDAQRATFAVSISRIATQLTLRDIARQSEFAFGQSAIFAAQCVGGTKDFDASELVASEVIKDASSGIWAVEFFWHLPHERYRDSDEDTEEQGPRYLPKEMSSRLGGLLSKRLMDEIEASAQRPPIELLRRAFIICQDYGGLDRVKTWTKRELTRDPSFLGPFASLIMQGSYSGSERQQEWPGNKAARTKVTAYIDTEWLVRTFSLDLPVKKKNWGPYISNDEAAFRLIQMLKMPDEENLNGDQSAGSAHGGQSDDANGG